MADPFSLLADVRLEDEEGSLIKLPGWEVMYLLPMLTAGARIAHLKTCCHCGRLFGARPHQKRCDECRPVPRHRRLRLAARQRRIDEIKEAMSR